MGRSRKTGKQTASSQRNVQRIGFTKWQKAILWTGAASLVGALIWLPDVNMAGAPEITVYKSPTCGCCGKWIDHLREEGFKVVARNRQDMNQIKQTYGVEYKLRSCHTAVVEDYVLEGHVPAADIRRLLTERPTVKGLAVPGMPMGSPGMEGNKGDPYDVVAFQEVGKNSIFERH